MTDKEGEWPEWAKKAVAVAAVATVVIAARATEVATLQVKKSRSEGKSKKNGNQCCGSNPGIVGKAVTWVRKLFR